MTFDVKVYTSGELAVLDLSGELDAACGQAVESAYEEAIASDPKQVLLRFDDVSYIDARGIAKIIELLAEAKRASRTLLASGLSGHQKEIFEITRIADLLTIEEAAVRDAATYETDGAGGHQ